MNEEDRIRIYGNSKRNVFTKELMRLEKSKISKKNKQIIGEFHNNMFGKGCGELIFF